MRALVQRVTEARVRVGGDMIGEIGPGLCVLVGVTHDDTEAAARKLAEKVWHLRVFDDADGVMNAAARARSAAPPSSSASSRSTATPGAAGARRGPPPRLPSRPRVSSTRSRRHSVTSAHPSPPGNLQPECKSSW